MAIPPSLHAALSEERLSTYLRAAGWDEARALRLYLWNAEVGGAFLPLLGAVEVTLRNAVERRLAETYGAEWWEAEAFAALLGPQGAGALRRAARRVRAGGAVARGRLVADLGFGFWANMLLPKYATFWTDPRATFPGLPEGVDRARLHEVCGEVRALRNRVSHHEPLIGRDLSRDYGRAMDMLRWTAPEVAAWLGPDLRVMRLMRRKP